MMARIVRLSPGYAVAGELSAADFAEIKAQGFKSIIANRPDGESMTQLSAAQTEALALENGMAFKYLPLVMADVLEARTSTATKAAIETLPGPILAFCRSGTRSAMAWAGTMSKTQPVETVMAALTNANFEIPGLASELQSRSATDD